MRMLGKAVLSRVLQFGYNCGKSFLCSYFKEVLMSETKESVQVKAYLKPTCGWSNGVRAVLRKYSLPYEDIDILSNPVAYMENGKEIPSTPLSVRGNQRRHACRRQRGRSRILPVAGGSGREGGIIGQHPHQPGMSFALSFIPSLDFGRTTGRSRV